MASISTDAKGNRTIQFIGGDSLRRTIRLGKLPMKQVQALKLKVEALNAATITGHAADAGVSQWVANLDDWLADKLAAVGLIPRRESITLGAFLDEYATERTDIKPWTRANHAQAMRNLRECFGDDKPMRSFSTDTLDGDTFRRHLIDAKLGENTIRKRCQIAKLFFKHALKRKLVAANPFAELVGSVRSDRSKFYFVGTDEAHRVLDACPSNEWRLIFALSRWGGLRCPSEHLALRWQDVDWQRGTIRVRSPKTEHHAGHESRLVPMFPELKPYLESAWDEALDGAEYVIVKSRDPGVNWRTQFQRILDKARLDYWPRLFHNLRATRQTELTNKYPQHVVCGWLGNSQAVAQEHYLRTTDEHFQQAVSTPTGALHIPVQSVAEMARNERKPKHKTPAIAENCEGLRYCTSVKVLPDGLEPSTL